MFLRVPIVFLKIWLNAFQPYTANFQILLQHIMVFPLQFHRLRQSAHSLLKISLTCWAPGSRTIHHLIYGWIILFMWKVLKSSVARTAQWLKCHGFIGIVRNWSKSNTCYKISGKQHVDGCSFVILLEDFVCMECDCLGILCLLVILIRCQVTYIQVRGSRSEEVKSWGKASILDQRT